MSIPTLSLMIRQMRLGAAILLLSIAVVGCSPSGSLPSTAPTTSPTTSSTSSREHLTGRGTVDGGGGKGVLCKTSDGTETVKTLDLYELESVRGEAIDTEIASATALDDIAVIATRKLRILLRDPMSLPFSDGDLKTLVMQILKTEFDDRLKPQRIPLGLTGDATVPTLPKNCQTVQIAIWQPNGEIALDLNLWEKLNVIDQAALKLHEYVYMFARKEGSTTSDETRWLISSALSSSPLKPRFPESMFNPDSQVLWCGGGGGRTPYDGPNFELFGQKESENGVEGTALYLHYTRAGSNQAYNAFTRTRTFIPLLTLDALRSGVWPQVIQFHNPLRNYSWSFKPTQNSSALEIQDPSGLSGLSNWFCRNR